MLNKRIAALDLGSNSFHMIIAEINGDNFNIIDRKREVMRIGSGREGEHAFITEEEAEKSIRLLKEYKELASRYNAEIKAVATSAVRESLNRKDFTQKIYKETSIEVDIISGKKEAELIFLGASRALKLNEKKNLIIDIGGGSTEIIYGADKEIIFTQSLKLGSVGIMRSFFPGFIITSGQINLCTDFIREELSKNLKNHPVILYNIAAGASGTILSAASSIYFKKFGRYPEMISTTQITNDDLKEFSGLLLSKSTVDERVLIPGIEEKRADILPGGILILSEIFSFFNIGTLNISEYGLREGIIISYIDSHKN